MSRSDGSKPRGAVLVALTATALFGTSLILPTGSLAQEPPPALRRLPDPAPAQDQAQAQEPTEPELVPVPHPSLEGLEGEVADQLRETRAVLEETLGSESATRAEQAEAYGELGRLYQAYELNEPAELAYIDARILSPRDFRWAYYHAYLLQQVGRFADAETAYASALKIRPTAVAAMIHLGEVYLELGRNDMAQAAAERALGLGPGQPAAEALLGRAKLAQGHNREAIELFEKALAAVPAADRLHYPLGMAYRAEGEMDKAREELSKAGKVGLRPPDPLIDELDGLKRGSRVHVLRGRMAFRAGRYDDAAEEFRQAVEADGKDVTAHVNLGSALGQSGDVDGAIEQFRAALETDPGNLTAHFNLGVLLSRKGPLEEAIDHLQAAVDGSPGDGEAHLELGRALRAAGRAEDALAADGRAIERAPFSGDARIEEASLLVALGRYAEAADHLDEAYALMPTNGDVVYGLTRLLAAAPDRTVRDGEKAVDLGTRLFKAQPTSAHGELLAEALAEAGQCTEAAQWQRKVIGAEAESASTERLSALQAALTRYEAGPPCRPPGRDG